MTDTALRARFLSPQYRHPANVPRHRHQRPFSAYCFPLASSLNAVMGPFKTFPYPRRRLAR